MYAAGGLGMTFANKNEDTDAPELAKLALEKSSPISYNQSRR